MLRLGRTSLRLSLQFAFLYSVLSAVIFVGAYWFTNYEVRDWLHDQMSSDIIILAEIYDKNGIQELVKSVDVMADVNFENARIFQLLGPDGTILAGNVYAMEGAVSEGYIPADRVDIEGEHSDEVSGYWIAQSNIGPYTLLQGTGNHVIAEVLEALGITLVAGFILIMAFGTFAGVWVGRLTERRIEAISGTMEQVAAGLLAARIPTDATSNDDLSRVSISINDTLEQLENLMESQIQISSDIAHDLRTPLQRLRQRLEKMSGQQVINPQDAVIALEQTEDIISTFNALLRIAQIEAGDRRERFQRTDLRSLLTNVYEAFEPSAEDGGQKLDLKVSDQPVVVLGDPDLLMQLISNLAENALRHTPKGTTITLATSYMDECPVLSVSDTGTGIASQDREKVFRRFYRGEKSRTTGGNGLGLSLCKAIAELHHANLEVSDNQPGLRIETRFPPPAK
jgi:signal transduction histidine kinase